MDEQAPTPEPEQTPVDTTETAITPPEDIPTAPHAAAAPMAAAPEPLMPSDASKQRRFSKPLATAVVAGVVGLGVGAGAVALASGFGDGHHDRDGRSSEQMDRQMDRQDQRHVRMGGERQQQGGFTPPGNGGQMQGRTGGS